MKTVLLRAPLLTQSGYGVHSRQIFKWLRTKPDVQVMTQILAWGNTSWMIDASARHGLVGEILERSVLPEQIGRPDVSIQVQLPNEWDPEIAKVNVGVSAWVETDVCNPEWILAANRMSALIVPSNFTREVIERTGKITVPLFVVPEAFIDEVLEPELPEIDLHLKTDVNFLLVGQITGPAPENDRKNTFYALKWMCEQFKHDPDVGIVIKTNSARGTTIDKAATRRTLLGAINQVRQGEYPRIYLLHGDLQPQEMASLYRHPKIRALVSLTRGEGWGLPILEAAASGLPVVATQWSGHLDFLNLGRFIPVKYTLEQIPQSRIDNKIFMQGSRWAQPDEKDAKKKIAKIRSSPDIPRKWAQDLSKIVREKFSQEAINACYDGALLEYIR